MSYKEWKYWLGSMPWHLRWFVILVLVRPVVDNFYYLKNISPFLSPLYIVGILTPVLCVMAIVLYRKKDRSVIDVLFIAWTLIMALSLLFMFINDPMSKTFLEYFLKLSMPVYLYFFLRLLIRTQRDLDGVLQTFVYSSFFVIGVFLFELFVNPVKVLKTRDLERIQGYYGDVMNYAIYLTQGFLIMCYFYFRKKNIQSSRSRTRNLVITIVLCIACLFKISHTASYIVFISILALFVLFNLKTNRTAGFAFVLVIMLVTYFFGGEAIQSKIAPLVKTDIAVYEGKKKSERLLHGRVGRWKDMLEQYSGFPVAAQFFGMPLTITDSYAEVSTGAHNDFVRIMFFTGVVGLFVYLLILARLFARFKYLDPPHHFLALGVFAILLLYSVSTCPTLYAPMLYIILSVFCYLSLPESILKQHGA
jgi:O-antigen ligase